MGKNLHVCNNEMIQNYNLLIAQMRVLIDPGGGGAWGLKKLSTIFQLFSERGSNSQH